MEICVNLWALLLGMDILVPCVRFLLVIIEVCFAVWRLFGMQTLSLAQQAMIRSCEFGFEL